MEYEQRVRVRFPLGDCAGPIFVAGAFTLAHEVLEDFVQHAGFTWEEWFDGPDWGVPYRHADADFLKPIFPGDMVTARLAVTHLGSSSMVFRIRFETGDGEPLCVVRLVGATVDRRTLASRPTPARVRERLAPYVREGERE